MIGQNMLLKHKAMIKSGPYTKLCRKCKATLHQDSVYCSTCAHEGGFCAMCGKKIINVSEFRMDMKNKSEEMDKEKKIIKKREEQCASAKLEQDKIRVAAAEE